MSHTLGFAVIVERLELCCVCPECKSFFVHDLYLDNHLAANAYYLKDMVHDRHQSLRQHPRTKTPTVRPMRKRTRATLSERLRHGEDLSAFETGLSDAVL